MANLVQIQRTQIKKWKITSEGILITLDMKGKRHKLDVITFEYRKITQGGEIYTMLDAITEADRWDDGSMPPFEYWHKFYKVEESK